MRAPAFWGALSFVAGIVIADHFDFSTYLILTFLILLFALSLILLKRSSRFLSFLLLLTLFLAGLWRYELATSDFPWNQIGNFLNLEQKVRLTGQIEQDPDIRLDRTYLTVEVDSLTWQQKEIEVEGKILIKIKEPSNRFNYGDEIAVYGYLFLPLGKRNPGTFDYRRYLNTKGIYGQLNLDSQSEVFIRSEGGNFILSKMISPARKYILRHFQQSLPEPYSNFLAGFVLGEKRGMPEELRQKFVRTGTLHLMAVSGSNVGLVLAFAYLLAALLRLPRWIKFTFLTLVILFFALLTNLQPSVVRASVMALLALVAFYTERDINFLNLVSFTVFLILIFNPQALYDVSFQLSFASVAAIGILVPPMTKTYERLVKTKPKYLYRFGVLPFFVSTAAILGAAPLTVFYFDNFAPIGFVSNLVIVPLVGGVVILASLSSILSLIVPLLAAVIVYANWLLLKITLFMVDFFGSFSFSLAKVPHPPAWVFWLYPVLLLLLFFAPQSRRIRFSLGLALLLTLVFAITDKLSADGKDSTQITILDVSPATAIFLELPTGTRVLFLRETRPVEFDYLERTVVPFLYKKGINSLDAVVLIDPAPKIDSKISTLNANLSIKQTYVASKSDNALSTIHSPVHLLSDEPVDLEGVKLSVLLPDNRDEPIGALFEFKDFTLAYVEQNDFFEQLDQRESRPVIACLNYAMFIENRDTSPTKLKSDQIIITGWDFKTSRKVERNLNQTFPGQKLWWTKKSGAIQIQGRDGKFEYQPTLEE